MSSWNKPPTRRYGSRRMRELLAKRLEGAAERARQRSEARRRSRLAHQKRAAAGLVRRHPRHVREMGAIRKAVKLEYKRVAAKAEYRPGRKKPI